jgi:hypothetical protein
MRIARLFLFFLLELEPEPEPEKMSMAVLWPGVHAVPAASCCTIDQAPLAHCWKEVPAMQFHMPSVVQAVPAAMAALFPLLGPAPPVPDGAADGVTEAAAGTEGAGTEAAGIRGGAPQLELLGPTGLGITALGAAAELGVAGLSPGEEAAMGATVGDADWPPAGDEATVAKTPPERAGADVVAADESEEAEDDGPAVPAAAATAVGQDPVGGTGVMVARPNCSRESPGSGKAVSALRVAHPLPTFATNISGRAS